jgi:hypothetical protein
VTAPPFLDEARLCEALGGRENWRERYREFVETSETEGGVLGEGLLLF